MATIDRTRNRFSRVKSGWIMTLHFPPNFGGFFQGSPAKLTELQFSGLARQVLSVSPSLLHSRRGAQHPYHPPGILVESAHTHVFFD